MNYWTFGGQSESIYISGPKYDVAVKEKGYKRHLRLTIHKLEPGDFGLFKCHAQNQLGRSDKIVKVYGKCKAILLSITTPGYFPVRLYR